MPVIRHHRVALSILPALLFAACGQQGAGPGNDAAATPAAQAEALPPSTPASSSMWNQGKVKPLDIQVAHPSGVVLQLTSLQSRQTDTVIGVRVTNGRDREAELNRFNSRDGFLLLDTGERLYLSPPASNTKLTVPAGQTFEGELVFLGRLPQVRSAVMVLNENSSTDSEYTNTPGYRIDLPLGGAAQ